MTAARSGTLAVTAELDGNERAYLELEALAAAAFYAFAFANEDAAAAFRQLLLQRGAAEYAPPASRLLLEDGAPVGMFALLPSPLLLRRRLAAAVAIARTHPYSDDADLQQRLRLAGAILSRPATDDAYLSRIAVSPRADGRGLGRWLLQRALGEALLLGARRCVLDVSADNARAIGFYARAGFSEDGRDAAEDPGTGRRLAYLHMVKALPGSGDRAIRPNDDLPRARDRARDDDDPARRFPP